MTAEQFRDCFVGERGYEALKKLMKSGNEHCTDIAKCWQERYDLEIAYAKGLRKNSETFQKLSSRTKGSLVQAFTTIATQINIESEAHNSIANILLNKISIPMKNLADTQLKARKPIEDVLNGKFKVWKDKRETDTKYRQRQFDNCKEIEGLYLRMDEIPKTTKNSSKETGKEVHLVTACVSYGGYRTHASEKIEMSLRKLEQELEKNEKKYHESTKEVEIARQTCDAEMCRSCDQMQTMELDRINEMEKFIQTYTNSIQKLSETMNQITQELFSIRITPQEDIVTEGKLNLQTTETEILLYDIYAENEPNTMSQERRILSLMHWMQMLKQDIEIQRRSKDATTVFPLKSREGESPDDDRSSSSDGAMRSRLAQSQTDIVAHGEQLRESSSSSSNDDDGAMCHHKKRENRKKQGIENLHGFCKQNQKFSSSVNPSELFTNRESVRLLQCLYQGSLYKMEVLYNQIKHLPEPQYEHSQRFAKSYTDKGVPTTFLRIPFQPLSQTPPSAPSAVSCLARSTPVFGAPPMMQQPAPPPPYSVHNQPPIGWAINDIPNEHSAQVPYPMYNRSMAPTPPYPVLPSVMTASTDSLRKQQSTAKHVKVLHAYDARHDDELSIRPGDIIVLMERRADNWFRGNLDGNIGLFPGNFVQEL
ncbi:unnamed protein product [Rotaria magnacalcarata]|uniref:Nostrin n=1 Tax=Rotaria magnacalcarata TaxID=392030 RepID=A0A816EZ61_9BILA|nr:unnamed protein product [Rotaria magnacalcarata]CAF1659689.1 unnamed protein product [Rotaria magnacalcarata]